MIFHRSLREVLTVMVILTILNKTPRLGFPYLSLRVGEKVVQDFVLSFEVHFLSGMGHGKHSVSIPAYEVPP